MKKKQLVKLIDSTAKTLDRVDRVEVKDNKDNKIIKTITHDEVYAMKLTLECVATIIERDDEMKPDRFAMLLLEFYGRSIAEKYGDE